MEIKILKEDKEQGKISFVVSEIGESMANAIRRSTAEIPILAIDEVEFYKNDSALYDEILAHRLALIPLRPKIKLAEREKCSCKGEGCKKCTVEIKLSAKGPATVYAEQLEGNIDVVYGKMPIVVLEEGQELELVAYARLGKAIEHAKFSPGLVYYRNVPNIKINKECETCEACANACPTNAIAFENGKLVVKDVYACDLCEACVEACKKEGKEDGIVIEKTNDIIFFIESWGQIPAREIFGEAIKVLRQNLKETAKALK